MAYLLLDAAAGGPAGTRITLPAQQPFRIEKVVTAPPPTRKFDENFGIQVELYEGAVSFKIPVKVLPDAPSGAQQLTLEVRFQSLHRYDVPAADDCAGPSAYSDRTGCRRGRVGR